MEKSREEFLKLLDAAIIEGGSNARIARQVGVGEVTVRRRKAELGRAGLLPAVSQRASARCLMHPKTPKSPANYIWGVAPALWQHPTLSLLAKGTATVLLMHYNVKQGECFPEYETLALELGLSKKSRPTVNRVLQELKDAGLIDWERHGRANRYDVSGLLALCNQKLLSSTEVEKAVRVSKGPKSAALPRAA